MMGERTNANKQLYQMSNDDEWYTHDADVQYFIEQAKIPKDKVIWCPFDMPDSAFVKVFAANGYQTINSHIRTRQDFYTYEPKARYDVIVSNPPFKNKADLMNRLVELDKPFALLFGIQCFNTGRFNRMLKRLRRFQIVILEKRIKYWKPALDQSKNATFHSFWLCNDLFDRDIQIWTGYAKKKQSDFYEQLKLFGD